MRLHRLGIDPGQRVARDDPTRDLSDGRPEAPRGLQRDGGAGGQREDLLEVEDPLGVGAAEPVDGLVRITHRDHLCTVGGQLLQQGHLRRIGVLVLVDEDRAQCTDRGRRVPTQQIGGPVDHLRVVDGAGQPEDVEVLAIDARGPRQQGMAAGHGPGRNPLGLRGADERPHLLGQPATVPGLFKRDRYV